MISLRKAVEEYVTMRRNLGFKLKEVGPLLLDFVGFLKQHRASYITIPLALTWAKQSSGNGLSEARAAQRLSFVRLFARYRSATDPRTQVPPAELLPFRPQRAKPYLYSDEEIEQLLQATLNMPLSPRHRKPCALLPWVYYCLFGLLSVTGLRLGEARNLKLEDVDLKAGVLTIRDAKFGRDRLVPLHVSTCKVLANYIVRRRRHWKCRVVSSYLFVSSWGNRLDSAQIHRAFYAASRQI
ncbi:MAG: tyrosine-type recombinase/integrase, partial [Exilibacterium sp.]